MTGEADPQLLQIPLRRDLTGQPDLHRIYYQKGGPPAMRMNGWQRLSVLTLERVAPGQ